MQNSKNYRAMLNTIAWSEGTDKPETQPSNFNGYDVLVGGKLFYCFDKHPRILVRLPNLHISSTAAGRYQMIWPTWSVLAKRLGLRDFTPASQDRGALELLRECGALDQLDANNFEGAVKAARKIWASLPGAGYGQREQKLVTLRRIYQGAGGVTT